MCENEAFGLAKETDASCAAPTQVAYFYRSKPDKKWKPFLSCEGMMINKGKAICDGTSDKLPALIRFT